ncbi:MAG: glycosyl hydrolase family 57, partial [bacterium]
MMSTKQQPIAEIIDGLPNICGFDDQVMKTAGSSKDVFKSATHVSLNAIQSAFVIALHMHQPTIPAGGNELSTAALIGNLEHMFNHPHVGDNHNASVFVWCYGRMADFIRELVNQGKNPRVMLDYSGNLLWALRQMGKGDVLENLKTITCDDQYSPYVEWLGTMWGHAVVSSTPVPDFTLHIRAWQHHFAAIFGWKALCRVKGFSPPEMHLPNHPDVCYDYVKALIKAGYQWLLVQEHTVENMDGSSLLRQHLPHRLIARNSEGQEVSITALIKTQGSDTKLVAQMQPYYEAKGLGRMDVNGVSIPPLVVQIGDGENGGVMMNEFPDAFQRAF